VARTQAERRETTRAALLAAARELFAERGFTDTGREDIAERAGVTRGALYHHFDSKAAVAQAVLVELNAELAERMVAVAGATSEPGEQLRRGARAYVEACADPGIARIVLEAPLFIPPERLRAMGEDVSKQLIEPVLEHIEIDADRRITALLILGMLEEAARVAAASPIKQRKVIATVDALLVKLLA
jgi:AcrR family transcriptional regulator